MPFGLLLIFSGLLVLLGTTVIAILFGVNEKDSNGVALVLATLMSAVIAAFNYLTLSAHSLTGKLLAVGMGLLAMAVAFIFKKNPGVIAKFTISCTILIGLSQLVFIR